jgi:peptidyl-prolyl cis-trans isomerase D
MDWFGPPQGESFMFRLFQKHREKVKKYLLIFFLSVVSVGMVITLAPIPGGDTSQSQSNVVATIAGDKITTDDLSRSIQNQLKNSQLSDDSSLVPKIADTVLDNMLMQKALVLQAQRMGLEVSNQELRSALQALAWLYPKGKFVGMAEYSTIIQQQTGMTTQEFEEQYRESVLMSKLRDVVSDGVQVTPEDVHQEFLRRNRKAKVRYVVFDPSQLLKDVQITPQALEAFFSKDPSRYKVAEQRQARYVIIPPDAVRSKVTVSDEEMKDYYTQHLSDYRVPDRVKVSHILFKTTGKSPKEVAAIKKTAEEVLSKIKSGADFSAMAKKYSEDSTASNGGELGWIVHGQTVKPFEDAAFSMKPGQTSDLVKTTYGFHIIKVEGKETAHLKSFDEVKDSIKSVLEKQKLQAALQSFAEDLEAQFKAHPDQFDSTAKQAGLEAKQTSLFKYSQTILDFGSSEAFHNLAFELQLNEIGQPIAVPKGTAIIQVTKIVPAHQPELEEVHDVVAEDYRAAQSKVLAQQKASEFAQAVKTGDFEKIARKDGYTVQESKDFTSQDYVQGLGSASKLRAAFTLKPGETSGVISIGGGEAVFQVISQTPANEADFAAQRDQIHEQLLDQDRNVAFEIYRQNLKQHLLRTGRLKLNQAAMKTFLAGYTQQ